MKYLFFLMIMICFCTCKESKEVLIRADSFGREIEAKILSEKFDELNKEVDYKIFLGRLTKGIAINRIDFKRIKEEFEMEEVFWEIIITKKAELLNFNFIKSYFDEGRLYNLFILGKDEKFDFLLFELKINKEKVKIIDGYLFSRGLSFTEELKAYEIVKDDYEDVQKFDIGYAVNLIREAISKRDFVLAVELFESVPERIKKKKILKTIEVTIAAELNDGDFEEKCVSFLESYPSERMFTLYKRFLRNSRLEKCEELNLSRLELQEIVGEAEILGKYSEACIGKEI